MTTEKALPPAIPHSADRRLRGAGAEAAAVPAAAIEERPRYVICGAVPMPAAGVVAPRAVALDLLGRAHAGEKATCGT